MVTLFALEWQIVLVADKGQSFRFLFQSFLGLKISMRVHPFFVEFDHTHQFQVLIVELHSPFEFRCLAFLSVENNFQLSWEVVSSSPKELIWSSCFRLYLRLEGWRFEAGLPVCWVCQFLKWNSHIASSDHWWLSTHGAKPESTSSWISPLLLPVSS